ncbi:hypothetical protein ACJIZ3_016888 [Penstemon smallii]|uniref:Uncharacterized protein n=1 Tax=Penstemon smallii TaxID=265156 RepID=A0ABD3SUR9_9LAMI
MGWSYPDISLEDLMKLIKAFIDMLLLASGYQSTGRLAYWDSNNIKKAFQWALFLQNVSKALTSSDEYRDCVKELDTALSELTSNPNFPLDIAPLSCIALGRAMNLLLKRLINTLPLRETHLKSVIAASIEMDPSELHMTDGDCVRLYLEKLTRKPLGGLNLNQSRVFLEGKNTSSPGAIPSRIQEDFIDGDLCLAVIQELGKRKLAVSCSSTVETGLEILLETIAQGVHHELGETSNAVRMKHSSSLIAEELPVESIVWSNWKTRSLSYMLDKRTIRLVSGASLIFSALKDHWNQIFERLNISVQSDDNLCEMIELLLLGCIANRWSALIEQLMLVSYESTTISRLYNEVFNLQPAKSRHLFLNEEKIVMDYLEVLLESHLTQLWKLSPVIAAVAIPSWSQLFRSYLLELEGQFRGISSATRCCSCITDGVGHRECKST